MLVDLKLPTLAIMASYLTLEVDTTASEEGIQQ